MKNLVKKILKNDYFKIGVCAFFVGFISAWLNVLFDLYNIIAIHRFILFCLSIFCFSFLNVLFDFFEKEFLNILDLFGKKRKGLHN